jgi:hypothetical protein
MLVVCRPVCTALLSAIVATTAAARMDRHQRQHQHRLNLVRSQSDPYHASDGSQTSCCTSECCARSSAHDQSLNDRPS